MVLGITAQFSAPTNLSWLNKNVKNGSLSLILNRKYLQLEISVNNNRKLVQYLQKIETNI